jgi:DNA-binding response OmpR family regulator
MTSRILSFKRGAETQKAQRTQPIRVLIVDDEEGMRKLVEKILQSAGYETETASDGDVAIAIANVSRPFDLLVTDEMMPRMVGHQLARYMRERYLEIKVLYLTGFSDELFKSKGSLWADEAFIDKPVSPEGLLQAVSLLMFDRLPARRDI